MAAGIENFSFIEEGSDSLMLNSAWTNRQILGHRWRAVIGQNYYLTHEQLQLVR